MNVYGLFDDVHNTFLKSRDGKKADQSLRVKLFKFYFVVYI